MCKNILNQQNRHSQIINFLRQKKSVIYETSLMIRFDILPISKSMLIFNYDIQLIDEIIWFFIYPCPWVYTFTIVSPFPHLHINKYTHIYKSININFYML